MPEQTPAPKSNRGILMAAGIIAIIVIIFGVIKFTSKQQPTAETTTTTPPSSIPNETTNPGAAVSYKDGTYTATGSYVSPGGPETIKITLTLTDGVVTEAVAEPQAVNPTSKRYQGIFAQNFRALVVGKDIRTLSLQKVSGSSLTSGGFNEAVDLIKAQSKT